METNTKPLHLYTLDTKLQQWVRGGILSKDSRTITLYELTDKGMVAFGTGIY